MFPFERWRVEWFVYDVGQWWRDVQRRGCSGCLAPLAYALAGVVLGLALIRILLNRSGD